MGTQPLWPQLCPPSLAPSCSLVVSGLWAPSVLPYWVFPNFPPRLLSNYHPPAALLPFLFVNTAQHPPTNLSRSPNQPSLSPGLLGGGHLSLSLFFFISVLNYLLSIPLIRLGIRSSNLVSPSKYNPAETQFPYLQNEEFGSDDNPCFSPPPFFFFLKVGTLHWHLLLMNYLSMIMFVNSSGK